MADSVRLPAEKMEQFRKWVFDRYDKYRESGALNDIVDNCLSLYNKEKDKEKEKEDEKKANVEICRRIHQLYKFTWSLPDDISAALTKLESAFKETVIFDVNKKE